MSETRDRDRYGNLWTFGTLKIYYDQRIVDLNARVEQRINSVEDAIRAAMLASDKAVDKAEHAQALRNEQQNEFRKSLSDLSNLMWTTKEGTAMVEALRREVFIKVDGCDQQISALTASLASATGKTTGISNSIVVAMAGVAIVISLVFGVLSLVLHASLPQTIVPQPTVTLAPPVTIQEKGK